MPVSSDMFCVRMEAAAQAAEAEVRVRLWRRTAASIRRTFEAELEAEQVRLENEAVIARARYNAMEMMEEKMRIGTHRKNRDIESKLVVRSEKVRRPLSEKLSSKSMGHENENFFSENGNTEMKEKIGIRKMDMEIRKSERDSHNLENENVMTIVQMKEEVEIRKTEMKIEIQRRKKEAKIRRMEMEEEMSRRKRDVENSRRKMKREEENSRGNKEEANSEGEKEEGSNRSGIEEEIKERETEIEEENEDKRKIENQEKRKIEEVSKIEEEKLSEETVESNVEKCEEETYENKEAKEESSDENEEKEDRPYDYRDQYREKRERPPRKSTSIDEGLRPGRQVLECPWSPNPIARKNDQTVKNPKFKPSKTELRNKCHHRKKMRGIVRSVQRHSFCCGPGRVRFARDRTSSRPESSVIGSVNKIKIGRS